MNAFWAAVPLIWHEKDKKKRKKITAREWKRVKNAQYKNGRSQKFKLKRGGIFKLQIITVQFKLQASFAISEILTTSKGHYLYG